MNSLTAIAAGAQESGLEFLLAGGHAVIAHGYARNTFDLDLIIRRSEQSQWRELAARLGYQFYREGPNFLQFNPEREELLPVDLMLVNEETFAKLLVESLPAPGGAAGVRVVSLRHLLALKCHAVKHGHAGRIVKDVDDVIRLVQANGLDVNEPQMRNLLLKHGTADLYEKLQRLCREP